MSQSKMVNTYRRLNPSFAEEFDLILDLTITRMNREGIIEVYCELCKAVIPAGTSIFPGVECQSCLGNSFNPIIKLIKEDV